MATEPSSSLAREGPALPALPARPDPSAHLAPPALSAPPGQAPLARLDHLVPRVRQAHPGRMDPRVLPEPPGLQEHSVPQGRLVLLVLRVRPGPMVPKGPPVPLGCQALSAPLVPQEPPPPALLVHPALLVLPGRPGPQAQTLPALRDKPGFPGRTARPESLALRGLRELQEPPLQAPPG